MRQLSANPHPPFTCNPWLYRCYSIPSSLSSSFQALEQPFSPQAEAKDFVFEKNSSHHQQAIILGKCYLLCQKFIHIFKIDFIRKELWRERPTNLQGENPHIWRISLGKWNYNAISSFKHRQIFIHFLKKFTVLSCFKYVFHYISKFFQLHQDQNRERFP